jgi:hypothetical protein
MDLCPVLLSSPRSVRMRVIPNPLGISKSLSELKAMAGANQHGAPGKQNHAGSP